MDEQSDIALALWSHIGMNLGGLYVSYLATRDRLDQINGIKWYDPDLDRFSNKQRMKEVGGAYYQYLIFLKTSAILNLAKAIEDCIWIVEERTGKKTNFWKAAPHCDEGFLAMEIRSLSNVIKHNYNIVRSSDSISSAYLVTERGYEENIPLEVLMVSEEGAFDVSKTISRIYIFLISFTKYKSGISHSFLALPGEELHKVIKELLVPEVLGL